MNKADLYQSITDKIIAALESGVRPWLKPWDASHIAGNLPLRSTGQHYRGINTLLLWCAAAERGYSSPYWTTYKQAQALGGQVRKGERGEMVVFASAMVRNEGEEDEARIPFLKRYTVFNVEQCDGLPAHFYALQATRLDDAARDAAAEAFFAAIGASVGHGGNKAFYQIAGDRIQMPPFGAFSAAAAYYATLAHEHVHWTRHPSRLDRDFGRKRWGDEGYAMEELVAEIGASFVCAHLGLESRVEADHAPYVASWLKVLKGDKRAIFTAASAAQRAADFLVSAAGEALAAEPIVEAA